MTYYFIDSSPDELSGAFLYKTIEEVQEELKNYKNKDRWKIYKVTVEECPS